MSQYENEMWNAAEMITEWDANGLRYKALSIPREAIDEDDDNGPALMVIGLDSGNVRRVDELFDPAYDRMKYGEFQVSLDEILEHAPEEVREFAEEIGAI